MAKQVNETLTKDGKTMRVTEVEPWCPDRCPITLRPFFMWVWHPDYGPVPTYGGPYDSYTIPAVSEPLDPDLELHERQLVCHHFDHDEGEWVDDFDPYIRLISDDDLSQLLEDNDQ